MERLTFKTDGLNGFSDRDLAVYGGIQSDGSEIYIGSVADKLAKYEDLEEQGKMLKDPQELKDNILGRMKEFMDEYRSYSKSSIDHFGGKADAMETAMRIVKAMFSEKNI